MTENTGGRPNHTIPWMTPHLMVKDVIESMNFYQTAFCMQKGEEAADENGEMVHGELYYQGQLLMIGKEGAYEEVTTIRSTKSPVTSGIESPINLYLYCENVDHFYQEAINNGAESIGAPEDAFWGDRFCRLKCPNGYIWLFATHITK